MAAIWKWVTKFEKYFFFRKSKFSRFWCHFPWWTLPTSPKNTIGAIHFTPSWTNYLISGQWRKFRSEIEKVSFHYKNSRYFYKNSIFWSKLKFERDKRSFRVIQDHSEHFKVRLGMKKLWKFNCLSKFHYLTLNDLRWTWMTSSDFSSYSNFNLLQKVPDIRYICT